MINLKFILFIYYKAYEIDKNAFLLRINKGKFRRRLKGFFNLCLKFSFQLFQTSDPIKNSQGIIYIHTKNNLDAIKPLLDRLPDCQLFSFYTSTKKFEKQIKLFPIRPLHIFNLFKINLKSMGYVPFDEEFVGCYKALIIDAIFYFNYFKSFLWKYKPSYILFLNDHHLIPRSLLLAANQAKIKTIYIQHASVSELFPPLDFSLALLEGKDALNKYLLAGRSESEVKLIGMLKADQYKLYLRKIERIKKIGICFNMLDDLDMVCKLYKRVKNENPGLHIIVRPHPGENRSLKIIRDSGATISNSKLVSSFEFLSEIDLLIAGDTSIHLEATLLGIVSLYYRFNFDVYDYYSFVKNGLVVELETYEDFSEQFKKLTKQYPSVRNRAKYFNEVIETANDWDSQSLAVKYINKHVSNDN